MGAEQLHEAKATKAVLSSELFELRISNDVLFVGGVLHGHDKVAVSANGRDFGNSPCNYLHWEVARADDIRDIFETLGVANPSLSNKPCCCAWQGVAWRARVPVAAPGPEHGSNATAAVGKALRS